MTSVFITMPFVGGTRLTFREISFWDVERFANSLARHFRPVNTRL